MTQLFSIFVTISMMVLLSSTTYSWTTTTTTTPSSSSTRVSFARSATGSASSDDVPQATTLETKDPCWQTFLDDDCSMGNIYSASFIASKWIKSMPCGEGIEDCDMPTALTAPETRGEAGVEKVDVMSVLGLKRAKAINSFNNELSP